MEFVTAIGYLASLCSIVSFTPQAWKIIKSRDVHSISAAVTGFVLWTAFGLFKDEWPIIITNSVCAVLSGFILLMKLLPARKRKQVAETLDPAADT